VYDGNGIENIQWSPTGRVLLIEVSQWTWGTDSTWNVKYILVDAGTAEVRELPIKAAVQKHFTKACAWLAGSGEWLDDREIDIELQPYKDVDEEGAPGPTPSCVAKPTRLSFDVNSGTFSIDDKSPYHSSRSEKANGRRKVGDVACLLSPDSEPYL